MEPETFTEKHWRTPATHISSFLTPEEAAAFLGGLHARTVTRWAREGYEHAGGKRIYRTQTVGTVATLPLRRDAEKAVAALRVKINSEIRSPETVSDLIAHYLKHELTTERKAYSTVAVNSTFLRLYVAPTWGNVQLSMVKSVAVEQWLSALPLSPAFATLVAL